MSAFARWMHGREYITLLLNWRWLVLAIAIPISLVIEVLEGRGEGLHLLDEVLLDGLVLPVTTWVVLTFAARHIAAQFEREAAMERRQQFTQRLSEHSDYYDLTHFLVRFPVSILPVERVVLEVIDTNLERLKPVAEWNAPNTVPRDYCDYHLVLIHEQLQVGVLKLSFATNKLPAAVQKNDFFLYASDIAAALARAIEAHYHTEQAYREARAYERRRITQELHDSLAQQIFYLHLGMDQLAEDPALANSELIKLKLSAMREVAADVYEQIRNNLSILRAWEQVNLTEAVTDHARVTARNASMSIDVDVQGEPDWLSPHSCEQLYGVVREALNNVVKHAQAKHVQLKLIWSAEHLLISLEDDGVGFDLQQVPIEGHYGLTLMREAVDALHGEFTIESSPGSGTRVQASIPLQLSDRQPGSAMAWSQRLQNAFGAPA